MSAKKPGETENLTELENLNEETLLNELKVRYRSDTIYTYVGEILVAVNPFKRIGDLYNDAHSRTYSDLPDKSTKPPHIFATADNAFNAMKNGPAGSSNQVCVISGESGAGKTESAKLFIKQIINLSKRMASAEVEDDKSKGLEEKIVQLNPLLEAFGNAQTLMNDNSSRFGKFIELRFNKNIQIEGALMYEYLLEKSRVVYQGEGERNFHVFYLFFAGLTGDGKTTYQMGDPMEHRYINSNEQAIAEIKEDRYREMYRELTDCMGIVGFEQQEVSDLFHLLSAVLHTGDVEFGGDDEAYIVSADDVLARVVNQLSVDGDNLKAALLSSTSVTRGESITRQYKPDQAEDARDAMAKALYGRAFSWIVKRVNLLLGPKSKKPNPGDKSIGILDIFGFECFDQNSFEQLLINLANEQLQFFFNNHIFAMELEEYAREGIDGSKISYQDNQPVLDMLLSKPLGLLSICDEESLFPKGSDTSMCEKFGIHLGKCKDYEKPKGNEEVFTIAHYAGKVTYEAEGFLEKNRDTLAMDVIACLRLSECALVATLFGTEEDTKAAKKGGRRRGGADGKKDFKKSMRKTKKEMEKTKKTTVSAEFKKSLQELMEEMNAAHPHFIRCVKPNNNKVPDNYDDVLVTKQLRYTGMLETTRIRKEGYSQRPTFPDFLDRYKIIGFGFSQNPPANDTTCRKILQKSGVEDYQIGKTKVFLRYWHVDQLNQTLLPFPTAAIKIQKMVRGFLARRLLAKLKANAAREAKMVEDLCRKAEKGIEDMRLVMLAIIDEDNMRPADFWDPKKKEVITDPALKKFQKKNGSKPGKGKAGLSRAASVRWFKEVEMQKGAGLKDSDAGASGGFQEWFHGIISRKDAENLLADKEPGTFLVRVSESRFGYSLSHCVIAGGRIKHYMIDQTPDGQYQVVGNRKLFPSLNELVQYHSEHHIVANDPVTLMAPCGQEGEFDDTAELLESGKKKKK